MTGLAAIAVPSMSPRRLPLWVAPCSELRLKFGAGSFAVNRNRIRRDRGSTSTGSVDWWCSYSDCTVVNSIELPPEAHDDPVYQVTRDQEKQSPVQAGYV